MDQIVGIVLVSHSGLLATGLRDLLAQIGSAAVPVAVAGGTPDGEIGTSYELVAAAIAAADRGAGVIVLPDLGSSVLTATLVLEDDPRTDVLLVDAPFVEGAVAAAVTAAGGGDLAAVAAAARGAWAVAKVGGTDGTGFEAADGEAQSADGKTQPAAAATEPGPAPSGSAIEVTLPADLHARPAGRFVREAVGYAGDVRLEHDGRSIDPTGILAVLGLAARRGTTVTVRVTGPDAEVTAEALAAILAEAE